jgi:FkbM family methyltransferase
MVSDRLSNLTIAAGIASAGGRAFGRNDLGYLTSVLSGDYFFRLAKHLRINHLVECGANHAETSRRFVAEGLGTATAIEANPVTFKQRTSKSLPEGLTALNMALGKAPGDVTLKVPVIDNVVHEGASSIFSRNETSDYQEFQIKLETLDGIERRFEMTRSERLALWIDVEGVALQVLEGAQQLLDSQKVPLIYVEVESHRYWDGQHLASAVDSFLSAMNYTPLIRDIQSENQYNLVYVLNDLIDKCDELTIAYWSDFSNLKATPISLLKKKASKIKLKLLRFTFTALLVHLISALLGSRSSRSYLLKKFKG